MSLERQNFVIISQKHSTICLHLMGIPCKEVEEIEISSKDDLKLVLQGESMPRRLELITKVK